MNRDRQLALDYLRAPANGFWQWAESGTVLVWKDGTTIAFREEILQILEWLAPNGLPSFGAIAFLLAACKGKIPPVEEILTQPDMPLSITSGAIAPVLVAARQQFTAQLEVALSELEKLQNLPSEIVSGAKAKCVLSEAVFEDQEVERFVDPRAILRGLRGQMGEAAWSHTDLTSVRGDYVRQIHAVAAGLRPHSAESLALRLRTGLDVLPKAADAGLPASERARRLIEELSRDREHGSMARAARELLAAVRLPRRLGERDELAIGGVADITNRGSLDRLLLSELAHDDLTLSVRVALNEALYLRREPPRREPPGALALLLDSGIRLWGMPRVLAAAVAMALIACEKQHAEILVWRAHGGQLRPVDLLSRTGLTKHLGALEVEAHPGEALAPFLGALPPGGHNQSVLITHRDVLEDPDLRRAVADNAANLGFIVTVDRVGRFELHALPLARRPPLCEADLDLNSIFDSNPGGASVIRRDAAPDLPAIFGLTPFPFLLPIVGRMDYWTRAEDGYICAILNDRRLVQYRNDGRGGRVLASDLPPGKTLWMTRDGDAAHVVKLGANQRPLRLLTFPLPNGPLRVIDLAGSHAWQAVHRCGDVILLLRTGEVRAFSLADGRQVGQVVELRPWLHGRFFRGKAGFLFATWDGERIKLEPVSLPDTVSPATVSLVFDRDGCEGPWLQQQSGEVISSATGERADQRLPPSLLLNLDHVRISRDGHQLLATNRRQERGRWIDLLAGLERNVEKGEIDSYRASVSSAPVPPRWNLLRVIHSIDCVNGELWICGRKNRWHRISSNNDGGVRLREAAPAADGVRLTLPFDEPPQRTSHGCSLQTAVWPNGSKAFLDSRGILHLKSCDSSVPEISLVLSEGEVAAWTSNGHVSGPSFFFDGRFRPEPHLIFQAITRFCQRL